MISFNSCSLIFGSISVPSNTGQKFAFWEHKGLKYRLELGPKEIENNQCAVYLCSKPGAVAQRYKVRLDANGCEKLKEQDSDASGMLKVVNASHSKRSEEEK